MAAPSEKLTEAREKFYPVDCYLIDICLLIPRLADQNLVNTLNGFVQEVCPVSRPLKRESKRIKSQRK